jgi:hypothetical protein
VPVGRVLQNGNVDLICDNGTARTPSVGAELMATPTAPKTVVEQELNQRSASGMADQEKPWIRTMVSGLDSTLMRRPLE